MARMSAAARIELGQKMVALFAEAGHLGHNNRSVRFVQDMIVRMSRGKGMTPRQREWYDSAVLEVPPTPQNEKLVNKLRAAAKLVGMEELAEPLNDFAYKLSRGWNLSEKQIAFMNKMLLKAQDIEVNGPWQPSPEEAAAMELGAAFARRYSGYYLDSQPGLSKSLKRWHDWDAGRSPVMDPWSANKLMTLCKGERARMVDAAERWPKGGLVETKARHNQESLLGLVLDAPHVDKNGEVALLVLVDGAPRSLILDVLVKPRKARKKKVKV